MIRSISSTRSGTLVSVEPTGGRSPLSRRAPIRRRATAVGMTLIITLLTLLPMLSSAQVAGSTNAPASPMPQLPSRTIRGATPPGQGVNRSANPGAPATPPAFPAFPAFPARPAGAPGAPGTTPNAAAAAPGGATPSSTSGSSTNIITHNAGDTNATYEFNFLGMPLDQVLDEYAKMVNRTLLRANQGAAVLPDKATITLKTKTPLTREEAIQAMEAVLGMNGITVAPIGDKFAKVTTEAMASTSGSDVSTNDAAHLQKMGRFITQIVQWKYASAEDIKQVLSLFSKNPQASLIAVPSTQTLILRDYAENVQRMLEMLDRIDQPTPLEIKPEVIKIKYALASDIQQVLSSLGGGGSGVAVGRSTGGGGLGTGGGYRSSAPGSSGFGSSGTTSSMGGMGGIGGMGSTMGGMGATVGAGGITGGGGTRSAFQGNLQRLVAGAVRGMGGAGGDFQLLGQSKIIADERTNSLLVFANKDDMAMIKMVIDKLDVVLAQVLIEAIVMEVSLGNNTKVGVSYLQHQQTSGNVSTIGGLNNNLGSAGSLSSIVGGSSGGSNVLSGLSGGFSYLTSINRDLDIVMTAVQTDSRVNVLSRPRIQTSHAVPASLFVGDTVPYITGSYYGAGYGNSSQYQQKEVGISLEVLPLINPDGLVVMDIRQQIEQIGGYVSIAGAGDVPKTTKRNADAKVAVRDRETIMLGGFISSTKSKNHSGVPWLMDIPVLGYLFRSNSDDNQKVELIVLIRPTVLPNPGDAAMFAAEERDKLSGVKQAEISLREEERKRNEKIEAEMRKDAAKKARREKADAKNSSDQSANLEPVPHWEESTPASTKPVNSGAQ